jgi:hypothetical protein
VPKLGSRLSRLPGAAVRSGRRPGWGRYGFACKAAGTGGRGPDPHEQAGIRRSPRRRRPSGQPPPLPRHLQTTGGGLAGRGCGAACGLGGCLRWGFAWPRGGGDRRRRRRGQVAGRAARAGPAPGDAGAGGAGIVGGHQRPAVWAAGRAVDPQALASAAHRAGRLDHAGCDHPVHRCATGAAPPAVRGGLPHRVGRVGAAVGEDGRAGCHPAGDLVCAGARRPLATARQVGRGRGGIARRPSPPVSGGAGSDRRADRRRGRGGDPAGRLSAVRPRRGIPGHLPAGKYRASRCRWITRKGDPPRVAGPAGPGGWRCRAVRPGGVGRVDTVADQTQGRPRH